jgi:hypothetical protein
VCPVQDGACKSTQIQHVLLMFADARGGRVAVFVVIGVALVDAWVVAGFASILGTVVQAGAVVLVAGSILGPPV